MSDPYSSPSVSTRIPGPTWKHQLGFVPSLVRYLAAASILQLIFFAILRVALFLRVREFEIPTLFAMVSPILALGLAPLFFRRFTSTRTAVFTVLGCILVCLYLLVRFGYAWVAHEYHTSNVEPVLRRLHYVDLTRGNRAPPSMESYLPLDTFRLDTMEMGATTLTLLKQNISEELHIRCEATVEEAIRASAGFSMFDLGTKRDAELLICAGTIASLTIPSNDSLVYLDSHRVVLEIFPRSRGKMVFQQIQGDTAVIFFPDTAVFRIRHKRDSLRQWREDSARVASGKWQTKSVKQETKSANGRQTRPPNVRRPQRPSLAYFFSVASLAARHQASLALYQSTVALRPSRKAV